MTTRTCRDCGESYHEGDPAVKPRSNAGQCGVCRPRMPEVDFSTIPARLSVAAEVEVEEVKNGD